MFCIQCGREIAHTSSFCSSCGARQRQRTSHKQLTLSDSDKKIAGVCGGIAEYLDVDPTIVRLIWVALSVVPGGFVGGALAYGSSFRRPLRLLRQRLARPRRSLRQKPAE
jgi:phage shock protein C